MSEPRRFTIAELVADAPATLRRMRESGDVVAVEQGQLVVRYEAVRKLLQDPRLKPSFPRVLEQFGITSGPFYEWMSLSPLNMDGEEHRQWRQLMARTFTPKSVERLRPSLRAEAMRLVGTFEDRGQCEFVDAFARHLPSLGLCELIGVPKADREQFCVWADTIGLGFNLMMVATRIAEVDEALTRLLDYTAELVAERRRKPADDLVSRLAQAAQEGAVDVERIRGSVAGLVFAGHETTKNQLGWMIVVLSEVPAEWDRVAREPEQSRPAVEEILRLRSAATSVGRQAIADTEVGGAAIPAGSSVIASLWASNWDPAAFPAADRFSPAANAVNAQIAFGHGAHHCLGAALARAELQEALIALSSRITCPVLQPGVEFLPPIGINGPTRLPIAFSRRS